MLFLCRAIGGVGGSVAWAQLKFLTIECKSTYMPTEEGLTGQS